MKLSNKYLIYFLVTVCAFTLPSCGVYKFKDVNMDPGVKTIKITPFSSQARYVSPQLPARLTDAFQQKVARQTKLTRTNNDDAHYQVGGYISQYDPNITSGISGQTATTNRLTVSVHITFRNTITNKSEEYDVSRNFDYPARLSLQEAEALLMDDILRNMSDEIFNRIFSNW